MTPRKPTQDRKSEIEQATLALAYENGPAQVTTTMIARRLGVTQPAIYNHFPSKAELWQAITRSISAQIAGNIAHALDGTAPPLARLRHLVLGQLQLIHQTPALPEIMVMRDGPLGQGVARSDILVSMAKFQTALNTIIAQAQGLGDLSPTPAAQDLGALVMGLIQSLVLRALVTRNPDILLQDAGRLLDLQLAGFAPPAARIPQGLRATGAP